MPGALADGSADCATWETNSKARIFTQGLTRWPSHVALPMPPTAPNGPHDPAWLGSRQPLYFAFSSASARPTLQTSAGSSGRFDLQRQESTLLITRRYEKGRIGKLNANHGELVGLEVTTSTQNHRLHEVPTWIPVPSFRIQT